MSISATPYYFDAAEIRASLPMCVCIDLMRPAMIALASGEAKWLIRSFIPMGEARTFAQMPGALSARGYFGAKLISVFADPDHPGHRAHEGIVVLFEGERGKLVATADAGEITRIRTAAASAAATDALAREDASTLAIIGAGAQALAHIEAIRCVRPIKDVRLYARNQTHGRDAAEQSGARFVQTIEAACAGADIICTTTGAPDPILHLRHVSPGAHINAIGSSTPASAEIANDLVAASRFIADHRAHVLVHGGEFLRAKAAGLVSDDHIVAEIGEVFADANLGRERGDQITLYKSLGHAVQDLAALAFLYDARVKE